jgi:hypothetical protein
MAWKDVLLVAGPLLSLVGSVLGAGIAGYFVSRSIALQVNRDLKLQCYAAFTKFHAIISSVTEQFSPIVSGSNWHVAYIAKRAALEPVVDDLIALTHLTISAGLAERVKLCAATSGNGTPSTPSRPAASCLARSERRRRKL